jgi:hypothetical protein
VRRLRPALRDTDDDRILEVSPGVLESAVTEHRQAWDALKTRAAMAKVPNVEPDDYDRL